MSKNRISASGSPGADLIEAIQEFLDTAGRGETERRQDSIAVGRGVTALYFVDPEPPQIFFDPGQAGSAQLAEKYPNPVVARKQILSQARKFMERA